MIRPAPSCAVLATFFAIAGCATSVTHPDADAAGPSRTAALFARHCAVCHAEDGSGDGPAAPWLFPRPRDFGAGRFRVVSTSNGAPTDADLLRVLERGLPGHAMPAFSWLPAEDLLGLVHHVRGLAVARMALQLEQRYASTTARISSTEARALAWTILSPGEVMPAPPDPGTAIDAELLERGRESFVARCAACHGLDARGQRPDRAWAGVDGVHWARDLRMGMLEGGARWEDLAHRVLAGMPGAAMPPSIFEDRTELIALLAYVRSLLPVDADRRGVPVRRSLVAARVDAIDAQDLASIDFEPARGVDVVLMPLAVRDTCIDRAEVQAVHDGRSLAVRVRYVDPTRDDSLLGGNSGFADQCALEFSQESLPPLFGMGSHDAEVGLWHWAAFRSRDLLGALDLIGTLPPEALPNPPAGLLRPSRAGDVAEGSGLGVLRTAGPGEVAVRPRHSAGAWELTFVAKLASAGFDPQTLVPGSGRSAQWNLAIWNGSAEDVGARKAISIWHELVLGDGRTDRR
ncbi:MAG: c-type cytochrome [Planctomycetota bacterium]|nr:c-type cytochrome [Planctomycetota bacterium]MDA0932175.1 c-type cytochrome [Planctomycetota bacterium]MDA1222223.1 c-type cytochrome [Planctomycetota bacterium]